MEDRIRLSLAGLSYNPMQDGAFAILMGAEGSNKRIPIIIGPAEAQAIAIVIEHINPPRPVTHDLFATFAHAFGVKLQEVNIYKFEDGIFSSEMTFTDGIRTVTLDSRTSDAVAIAIRTGAPIYTTRAILDETGIEFVEADSAETDGTDPEGDEAYPDEATTEAAADYSSMNIDELNASLEEAIKNDDFEEAAVIRRHLDQRELEN